MYSYNSNYLPKNVYLTAVAVGIIQSRVRNEFAESKRRSLL